MLRLTLAQMRRSVGRLAAAGIAIAIGTAFVAATLIAGAVITRTSYDAIAASYADADLVVTGRDVLTTDVLDDVRTTEGVAAAEGQVSLWVELGDGSRTAVAPMTAAADPRLSAQSAIEGRMPERDGEVALPVALAERLEVEIDDAVTAYRGAWVTADATRDADAGAGADAGAEAGLEAGADTESVWVPQDERLTVVGLTDDPAGAFAQTGGAAVLTPAQLMTWAQADMMDGQVAYDSIVVALADGADVGAAQAALGDTAPDAVVRTKDEQAQAMTADLTNGSNVLTTVVLGFASVALLVAALVIANTFQVLIAQRTRTLALLRCVGADAKQLRRSVLLEATLLGLAASAAGVLLGVGVGQIALLVLGRMDFEVPLPDVVAITPAVVLAPLAVGTLVTVLASLAPARAATRVAPLAALRPADAPAVTQRRSRPRLVLSSLATLGGFALLALAVVLGQVQGLDPLLALAAGVLGGALSFVGVVVGSVFWLPRVVALAGRALGRSGPAARLAAANTVRNPRRTAATSTALLIGVTLVTMMSTGAASARTTLNDELNAEFPVDVMIGGLSSGTDEPSAITPGLLRTVTGVDGVTAAELVDETVLLVTPAGGGDAVSVGARVVAPATMTALSRTPAMADGLSEDTVVLSEWAAEAVGVADGDTVTMTAAVLDPATGVESAEGEPVQRTVAVTSLSGGILVHPDTVAAIGAGQVEVTAWARLADDADPATVVPAIQDALVDSPVTVVGAAVERAMYTTIIDTLLAVVVGLLGVAVVIALVGVANTLSLSVLERRRESATLRVIGLSKRQLRGTLALEGTLIAGVGAVLGIVLGVAYGWAGAIAVLGVIGEVQLDLPWAQLALVLVVSVAAGLVASVLPGRSAARTSPVAALAVD